jgi:hypothetical protein
MNTLLSLHLINSFKFINYYGITINQLEVKKFPKDDRQTDQSVELLTLISPPANENIHVDLVDPIPTPSNSIDNIFIPPTLSK